MPVNIIDPELQLSDFHTDRSQFSVINGQHSTVLNVNCGIAQGFVR